MAKFRISVPLYRKVRFEDGWKNTPIPADVIPVPENEWKWWFELPPVGRLSNPEHSFIGWAQQPLVDDNDLAFWMTETDIRQGVNRHSDVSWYQIPLSIDNDEAFAKFVYENPEPGLTPFRHSYIGWQLSPLVDDNDLAFKLVEQEVPAGRDRHSHIGISASPLADDNDEAFAKFHWALPELGTKPKKYDYIGWSQYPLVDDNELSTFHELFSVPIGRDRHSDVTQLFTPLGADFVEDQPLFQSVVDWTKGRDKNTYVGFQIAPIADDNDVSARLQQFENPEPNIVKLQFDYGGFSLSPLVDENELSYNAAWFTIPWNKDRHTDTTWTQQPLVDDIIELFSTDFTEYGVPTGLDKNSYQGFQQGIVVDDNDNATIQVVFDVPSGLDRTPLNGMTLAPLSGPFEETSSWVYELPVPSVKFDAQGWQFSSVNIQSVEDTSINLVTFDVPNGRTPNLNFTFILDRAIDELLVQETMPWPWYDVPMGEPVVFEEYAGPVSSPLSADAPLITDIAVWKPVWRPRRR